MESTKSGLQQLGSYGKSWSLDRRVPIAVVITTAVQLLAFAWFAIDPRPHRDDQDRRAVSFEAEAGDAGREWIGISDALVRLDHTLDVLLASLIRLESKLTRHLDDGR